MEVYKYVQMKIISYSRTKCLLKCSCKRHAQYNDDDSAIIKLERTKTK